MRTWVTLGMILVSAIGHAPGITLPKIDPSRLVWLGAAHTPYSGGRTSYIRRDIIKRPGRIRIGVFGPSVATTSEVGQAEDIPSHLQELLHAAGHTNVEVVGFGFGSAALQYSYLLWHAAGRRMEFDHVIVVVPQISPERETHFQGNGGVHGRMVLSGDGLKAIRPVGDTLEESQTTYHSLVPRWNYVRYDSRVPPLWKTFFPNAITNPFYYQPDPQRETEEVVARLLDKWAKEANHLSVYFPRQAMPTLEPRLTKAGIPFLKSQLEPLPEMYRSSGVHLSSLGNQARATELFHYLMGDTSFSLALLNGELGSTYGKARPWPKVDKPWHVFAGALHLGTLNPPGRLPRPSPTSLVAIGPFRYLEMNEPLKGDLPADLVVALPGKRLRFRIGHVRRETDALGVLVPNGKTELLLPVGELRWNDGFRLIPREKYQRVWLTLGTQAFPLVKDPASSTPLWSPGRVAWNFRGMSLPPNPPLKGRPLPAEVRFGLLSYPLPLRIQFVPRPITIASPYPWPLGRSLTSAP